VFGVIANESTGDTWPVDMLRTNFSILNAPAACWVGEGLGKRTSTVQTAAGADLTYRGSGAPGFFNKTALGLALARDAEDIAALLRAAGAPE